MSDSPTDASVPEQSTAKRARAAKPSKNHQPKGRPTKVLPTVRITFDRQLDILRAYAAASAHGTKATTLDAVSEIVKMVRSTVYFANPFFLGIGLIQRTDAGFLPAPEVVSFLRAFEWNRETAAHKLAPTIKTSWFAETLLPKLTYGAMGEEEAITCLGEAASAGPDYRKELRILLDYMAASGLIQRDGDQIKSRTNESGTAEMPTETQTRASESATESQTKPRVSTVFAQSTEGAVHFNVSVRVDMAEFSGWQPNRIAAFFDGIAKVLAAKANIEEEEATK